jgi:hypothetical protein
LPWPPRRLSGAATIDFLRRHAFPLVGAYRGADENLRRRIDGVHGVES